MPRSCSIEHVHRSLFAGSITQPGLPTDRAGLWDVQLASCGQDHKVFIWDCVGGAALHVLVGHAMDANCCSWHPSGAKLVSCGLDGRVIVWDAQTGTVLQELESMQSAPPLSPQSSPLRNARLFSCSTPLW